MSIRCVWLLVALPCCSPSPARPVDPGPSGSSVSSSEGASTPSPWPTPSATPAVGESGTSATSSPHPDLPTTIGDTTCATDADCTLTTQPDCCECCKSNARATSKAWLAWRDGTECKHTRCEPCGKVKCPFFDDAGARALCVHQQCTLVTAAH